MTLVQAILMGMLYWLKVGAFFYGGDTLFANPMCIGLTGGLILGDPVTGMKVGAMVQPMYMAFLNAGGTVPTDKCAAGIITVSVALTSNMPFDQSIALAATAGIVMAQLHTIRRIVAATWVHMADAYAEKCNTRGIYLAGLVYTNLFKIVLFWIPMTLMLYFGAEFIGTMMNGLPVWLKNGFSVCGKMMPALGYGMTIMVIGRKDLLPYFIAGFFFAKYSGLSSMPIALTALFVAFLDMRFANRPAESDTHKSELPPSEADGEPKRLLTKKDINRTWFIWLYCVEQSNSFERLQSLSFCISMIPILKKLYGNYQDEFRDSLKRHLQFFNTSGIWGMLIHGIVISMEEQRALGANVPVETIVGFKAGMMGPIAGIGDTIDWSTIFPLVMAFFLPYAAEGYWWAAIAPWLIEWARCWAEAYYFLHLGYRQGTRAALTLLQSGQVQNVISFFSVLGMFALGGLAANMVKVEMGLSIPTSGEPMNVQTDILDKIVPGMLSILAVMGVYGYLRKGGTMMKATLWILGIGVVLGAIGILAG